MNSSELKRLGAGAEEESRRLAALLPDAAVRRGLVDVAFGFVDSPFGPLLVAVGDRGLIRVAYPDGEADEVLAILARRVSPRVLPSPRLTDPIRRQIEEYFAGRRRTFDVDIDLTLVGGFRRRVLEAASAIPFGEVRTYREVAGSAGNPGATRAAGNALGANPIPIVVPCHRVVRTGGGLGGYTGGVDRKLKLLRLEGVMPG
jgi:methylated-DNA-[protein]-cysteine S-methyltransferase